MKRYISAILVPCLLMQLFGCYSLREMTLEELKNYTGPNDIKIKTTQKEILINRKSSGSRKIDWEAGDSLVTIKTIELITLGDNNKVNRQTNKIKYNEIDSIEIEDVNTGKTVLLIIGILGILTILSVIAMSTGAFNIDLSGLNNK